MDMASTGGGGGPDPDPQSGGKRKHPEDDENDPNLPGSGDPEEGGSSGGAEAEVVDGSESEPAHQSKKLKSGQGKVEDPLPAAEDFQGADEDFGVGMVMDPLDLEEGEDDDSLDGVEEDDDEDYGISNQVEKDDEEENKFEVLSTQQIVRHMTECIDEANVVLQLPSTTMRSLLNHFHWDRDKLLEAYYGGNQEKLFKDACVVNPNRSRLALEGVPEALGEEECEICYDEKPTSMMHGLACGHRFCTQCWADYLTTKIMQEGMGQTISCAAHKCPILVDDETVMSVLKDPQVKLKYQHLITNSFVQHNRLLTWCPAAGCTHAIRMAYRDSSPKLVTCACNKTFCFQCSNDWHCPVECAWLKKWLKKCADDSETSNWIAAHTKDCPNCHAMIEKNGGCNHMTCKKCHHHFCWVCLGNWTAHQNNYYNCTRYNAEDAETARDAQARTRAALNRYLFYFNRYMDHMQSLKFENKLYDSVADKQKEMQNYGMTWSDVKYLNHAVDVLVECRQTLMYAYVFAFYLQKTNHSEMFEQNQQDLQTATERLSEYLERDITSDNLADIKQKVQNKADYCRGRRNKLVDHVMEGQRDGTWLYNDQL